MRILYTAVDTPIPGTHGGSVHARELCRALAGRGHDVHIIAPGPMGTHGEATEGTAGSGAEHFIRVSRPPRFLTWSAAGTVRRIAARVRPDVLVERFYTFGGAGMWAAHRLGLPAVLEVNSPARPYPGSWRDRLDRLTLVRPIDAWRRRQLRWSDAIYATSPHLLPPELQTSVTVITNGVNTDRFRPDPTATRTGPLRCVYASSFRSWHGAEDLVHAVADCISRGVDLQVTCLGTGPRWDAARQAAAKLGVLNAIEFVGGVPYEAVPGYLARAEVGLAPFNPDAFPALQLGWFWSPIKLFEYLAAGLAVVTIDIAELRRLLPDSVARFYAPGRVGELADQLTRLATDRAELGQVRQVARMLAETRFTWEHQAAVVETVLTQAVTGR